jgi:hypothetical protein
MICAVHQPNYIPYLGFFDKYKKSDIFILYDTAQYSKNDFHNRNRIKTANGPLWITIPTSIHFGQQIKDATVADKDILKKHLDIIKRHYEGSAEFTGTIGWLAEIYKSIGNVKGLVDINVPTLKSFFNIFDGNKKILLASELGIDPALKSTAALVAMCRAVGADTYLSGPGAKVYLDESLFATAGIKLIWQDFHHPEYPQLWGEFIPNLSVVDALFNVGTGKLKDLLG